MSRSKHYFYNESYMREPAKYAGYEYKRTGTRVDDGRLRLDGQTTVQDTRIMRAVWQGPTGWNDKTIHPAVMPRLMAERCVMSITRPNDVVLDPFNGSGTTGIIAIENGRRYIGWELNEMYAEESRNRISQAIPTLFPT